MDPAASVTSPGTLNTSGYYENALTPDALMVYLSTRLGGLDEQIQQIFAEQQNSDKIRSAINKIQTLVSSLSTHTDKDKTLEGPIDTFANIQAVIETEIAPLNPNLAASMLEKFQSEGYILTGEDNNALSLEMSNGFFTQDARPGGVATSVLYQDNEDLQDGKLDYKTSEVDKTTDYLKGVTRDLESTSQMNMILLQSLMSNRQTAVSLSTNLIAKLNDSTQKVVENIR